MQPGDQVIAVSDISTGIFGSVRKGTKGVITKTSGLFTARYDVSFDNGQTVTGISGDKIRRI